MSLTCSYTNCFNTKISYSSLTFFNLPKDEIRRSQWIENSGNDTLRNCSNNINSRRFFCEKHFEAKYLRRQFTRTILRRDAIPIMYNMVKLSEEPRARQPNGR